MNKNDFKILTISCIGFFLCIFGCITKDSYSNYLVANTEIKNTKTIYKYKSDSIDLEKTKLLYPKQIEVKCE